MAAEDKVISAMDTISDADINDSGANDFVGGYNINGNIKSNKRYSFANFANFILNKYSILLGGTSQTVKTAIDSLNSKLVADNAGAHNAIYRGKYLGTSVTAAQWAAISSGTFTDLYIGDYWTINEVNWRIAAFDYWLNCGDRNCTTHHAVIVPDQNLLNADGSTTHYMNTSNIVTGGYMGTGFFSGVNADDSPNTAKSQCITKAQNAFGSGHILTHREYFSNATTNGYVSGGVWTDSTVDLMNEAMVYGTIFFENQINGANAADAYTIDKNQLPLFAHEPSRICNRASWWLRSVASASGFADVYGGGGCSWDGAATPWLGVRPAFGIK